MTEQTTKQQFDFFKDYELQGEYEIKGKTYKQEKISGRQELDLIKIASEHDLNWSDLQAQFQEMGLFGFIRWIDEQGLIDEFVQVLLKDENITLEDIDADVLHAIFKDFFLLNEAIVRELAKYIFSLLESVIVLRKRLEMEQKKSKESPTKAEKKS